MKDYQLDNISDKNNDKQNNLKLLFEKQSLSIKNDIIFFKEEILKELKLEKQDFSSKCNNIAIELQEKIKEISKNNIELNKKIENILKTLESKIINVNNEKNKIDYEKIKKEINREILSKGIEIDNLRKELKNHKEDYDNLIKNNIIYQGLIGSGCKYTNMHQFFDYLIINIKNLNRFKEQKDFEYKTYKNRIEKDLNNLNKQEINIIESCKSYSNQSLQKLEEKIFAEIKLYDSRLLELRVENCDYSKEIDKKINKFNEEYNKIIDIKNEINENNIKIKDEINELFNKENDLFNNYQEEFKSIKNHFNYISDFFKDLKIRAGLSNIYNKKELSDIKNNIVFENEEKKLKKTENQLINYNISQNKKIAQEDKSLFFEESKNANITEKKNQDILNIKDLLFNKVKKKNKNYNFEVIKNISFELLGLKNKNNILLTKSERQYNEKGTENSPKKIDKNIGNNEYISMNYENDSINNIEANKTQKNKNQNNKKLINEKLEKYKFLYEDNNIYHIYNKKKYPDFCVKNFNDNYNQSHDNIRKKERNMSALPGLKNNLMNNQIDYKTKDLQENNSILSGNKNHLKKEEINNIIKNNIIKSKDKRNNPPNDKNDFFNNSLNIVKKNINKRILSSKYNKKDEYTSMKSYTNRHNYNEGKNKTINKDQYYSSFNKSHNYNKSMENILINDNKEKLFYRNLSNNKIKVKNLADKK